ncbi:MAG: gluconokinase, partial [Abditibacteriota bacterium]|nr:gluconokinase [Abditibacteriota bacterium]
ASDCSTIDCSTIPYTMPAHSSSTHSAALIVALDTGTSSTRALCFDSRGHKIGPTAQHSYQQVTTPDGGVEVDADLLFDLTMRCLDELLPQLDGEIVAVAASCFWHSLMAVDVDGRPLTKVLSWADNRAAPWVAPLRALLDESETHARTGCVFHPSYWPAKVLWLHASRPELFTAQTRWMSFGEYLALRLTGEARVSLSMASGTGLFHQNDCDWDAQTLSVLPLTRENLSPLCDAHEALPPLLPQWQTRWPQLAGTPLFGAIGDGACSNIGSGGTDQSTLAMNCGTSGALRIVLEDWQAPPPRGLWRYRIDRRRSVLGGALSNAGNILLWARQTLQLPADWDAQTARIGPEEHGLIVLPFLAGERSPLWNARARFVIEGATLDTEPVKVLRACLEGAALRFKAVGDAVRDAMRDSGLNADVDIIFSGGALDASPAWAQIMADCIGAPLVESREKEASARGAALLALEAIGAISDVRDLPAERGRTVIPDNSCREVYERALERQNVLYSHLYEAVD